MQPLIVLDRATLRIRLRPVLREVSLSVAPGSTVAILGGNGSGKTLLSEVMARRRPVDSGSAAFPGLSDPESQIQLVSFEQQLRIMAEEKRRDESWLMHGGTDEGTSVSDFVAGKGESAGGLLERFGVGHLAHRGLRFLSTGEWRKTILCRALYRTPRVLVLDDPYDGLDTDSRLALNQLIEEKPESDSSRVLVFGRDEEIPSNTDTVIVLDGGRIAFSGSAAEYASGRRATGPEAISPSASRPAPPSLLPAKPAAPAPAVPPVVMRDVSVGYAGTVVLRNVTWTARAGETWHIIGPNGAGKSTLLSLIDGSNPKAYGQEIHLFGRRRGSGESVRDIRRQIGYVSADFHNSYPARTSALHTILSGFMDSAGLYEVPSGLQTRTALEWLEISGLSDRADVPLRRLSYGQQRVLLIARAVVKHPPLLIADEPAQGLDSDHSAQVLELLDFIARESGTCLLYVSHNPRQTLDSTTHRMIITPGAGGSTITTESLSSPASMRATSLR